jgi:hypothetical protein
MRYFLSVIFGLLLINWASAEPAKAKGKTSVKAPANVELIADRLGGDAGYVISAKFTSRERLFETLSLSRVIGIHGKKKYQLFDILVSLDLNANGEVATWKVSGPKALLDDYITVLGYKGHDPNKSIFYDFGVRSIKFKTSAEIEAEEGEQ